MKHISYTEVDSSGCTGTSISKTNLTKLKEIKKTRIEEVKALKMFKSVLKLGTKVEKVK